MLLESRVNMIEAVKKIRDLRPGTTLYEDVYMNTSYPIVRKNTILTDEHIKVLQSFGVREVKIQQRIEKKEDTATKKVLNADELISQLQLEKEVIEDKYKKTVEAYKKEFSSWRAGTKVDIAKVRSIIIPAVELFTTEKKMLTLLNDVSNSKDYIYHHSVAVGILSAALSKEMGFSVGEILQMGIAGVLADSGMSKIDSSIIEKVAFLTNDEFNEVKKHALYSYQMVKDSPLIRSQMKIAILQHHERLDGSGYPRGDKLEQIPIYSQILAVADVYHAMTSERVYREKESPFKVIEMLTEEEFGKFDILVVQALQNLIGQLTIGTKVKLTNGETGSVIFVHRDAALRPTIKLASDGSVLDLTTNRTIAVERVLN